MGNLKKRRESREIRGTVQKGYSGNFLILDRKKPRCQKEEAYKKNSHSKDSQKQEKKKVQNDKNSF